MSLSTDKKYFLFSLSISLVLHILILFFIGKVYPLSVRSDKPVSRSVMKITILDTSEKVKNKFEEKILQEEKKEVYEEPENKPIKHIEKEEVRPQNSDSSVNITSLEDVPTTSNVQQNEEVNKLQDDETVWFSMKDIKEHLSTIENRFSYPKAEKFSNLKKDVKDTISEPVDFPAVAGKFDEPGRELYIPVIPPDFNINRPPVYPVAASKCKSGKNLRLSPA